MGAATIAVSAQSEGCGCAGIYQDVVVSGAGLAEVNGTYAYVFDFDQRPVFAKAGSYVSHPCYGGYWAIDPGWHGGQPTMRSSPMTALRRQQAGLRGPWGRPRHRRCLEGSVLQRTS